MKDRLDDDDDAVLNKGESMDIKWVDIILLKQHIPLLHEW